jgi:hypothetical protein
MPVQPPPPPMREPARARARLARVAAPPVLAATLVVVVALAAIGASVGGAGDRHERPAHRRAVSSAAPRTAPARTRVAVVQRPHRTPAARAVGARSAAPSAAQLQAHGHELLEAGQGRAASARLSAAIAATGARLSECVEPASNACLTYAYALYDLGRALALEGRSAQAVSVLEQRLRIDNQRGVVASELRRVRASSGSSAPRHGPATAPSRSTTSRPKRAGHAPSRSQPPVPGGVEAPASGP